MTTPCWSLHTDSRQPQVPIVVESAVVPPSPLAAAAAAAAVAAEALVMGLKMFGVA
jgi:hypothetical protein